jgi:hypothetical protein
VQWYGNVPAVWNATENRPPGETIPEFHPVASDVEVWEMESVFVQVTVVPTATLSSSGMKALFPSDAAPTGIATDDEDTTGVVANGIDDGAVEGDEEPPPQANANIKIVGTTARRNGNTRSSGLPNLRAPSNIPWHVRP